MLTFYKLIADWKLTNCCYSSKNVRFLRLRMWKRLNKLSLIWIYYKMWEIFRNEWELGLTLLLTFGRLPIFGPVGIDDSDGPFRQKSEFRPPTALTVAFDSIWPRNILKFVIFDIFFWLKWWYLKVTVHMPQSSVQPKE